ncbi:MAG: GntR family transcriptional regulator [Acidobacteriaceae bacterium]
MNELKDVIDLRAMIEPDISGKAVPHLTTADLEQAKRILDDYEAALKKNEISKWGEYNWKFHSTLCAPSGCTTAMGILQSLHYLNERYANIQISVTHWQQRAAKEHREILAACRKRDRPKVMKLVEDHIRSAGQALITFLEQHRQANEKAAD